MKKIKNTISDLIMEYFMSHPKQDLPHGPVADWVEEKYLKLYKKNLEIYGLASVDYIKKVFLLRLKRSV